MKINYYGLLYIFQLFDLLLCLDQIFISPQTTCGGTCSGRFTDPFDNIFEAFEKAKNMASVQIIILSGLSTSHHYALRQNPSSPSSETGNIIEFVFKDLEIKPLYCNEEPALSDPTLSDRCYSPGDKPIIYFKTTSFKLIITGSIRIQGIILDGIEDIEHSNVQSSNLTDCISTKKRCCEVGNLESSIYPGLLCFNQSSAAQLTQKQNHSLFLFIPDDISDPNPPRKFLTLENLEIRNFISPHLKSLVQTGPYTSFNITINHTLIDRIYFNRGLISHGTDSFNPTLPRKDDSLIIFEKVSFTNYNNRDVQSQEKSRREGYLFYTQDLFSGEVIIQSSHFANFTSSLRDTCWPQTKNYYQLPMDNLLTSDPRSRTDLWDQYHQEISTKSDYGSSLISIKELNGSIRVSDSIFRNIIGTSGSVLRVDDVTSSSHSYFSIHNSIFDSNFAYDRFANFMIAKTSDPYFSSMLDCPRLDINNSTFKNTYGCPGAYGNILVVCYWDTQPTQSSLLNYSMSTKSSELISAWNQQSDQAAYIKVENSIFQNNMLAISNSVAIIGSYFTLIKDNIFQNNGGTTAEIAKFSLHDSYFLQRYPKGVNFSSSFPLNHFGQSTVVYFDHITKVHFKGNIFQGNWGPWEGSLGLGCSVTIKNWIQVLNGIKFEGESFLNHVGIPPQIALEITDISLRFNTYMDPILAISVDITGSSTIAPVLEIDKPVDVLFHKINFRDNILNYNYKSYAYNKEELGVLFVEVFPVDIHFQSGMVKLLWASEAIDDISYGFKNDISTPSRTTLSFIGGEVISNELQSKGCFFSTVSFFTNIRILNNHIYTKKSPLEDSIDFNIFYFFSSGTPSYGLLCQGTNDFIGSTSRLQIEGIYAKDNTGILINLFANTRATCLLMNSIFVGNKATSFGMIAILFGAEFTYINNIFTKNNNFAGSVFMEKAESPVGLFNVYLMNTGVYSSAVTVEYSSFGFEGLSKVYWNTLDLFDGSEETLIPVFGIFAINYITFEMFGSIFKENYAYSGVINAIATLTLHSCQFLDHYVVGSSVLGILPSVATLVMENILLSNNTIVKDPLMPKSQSGIIVAYTSTIIANNIQIINGNAKDGAMLIFANSVTGSINNLNVENFFREESGQSPLINLDFSTIEITNLSCSNVTGLFEFSGSSITLSSVVVSELVTLLENQFLFYVSHTNLTIEDFKYTGNGYYNDFLPLIGGDRNYISIVRADFENATGGKNKIFDLKSSEKIFVSNSTFKYSGKLIDVTVFDLTSSMNVIIENCFFGLNGMILQASGIEEDFYFAGNVILTNSHVENILLEYIGKGYIVGNYFLRQENEVYTSLPNSQIFIRDSKLPVLLQGNSFISLYGMYGIVEVRALSYPYKLNFTGNIFYDNTAVNGGSIYLHNQNPLPAEALIQNSDFVRNKALNWEKVEGKGGALYITSTERMPQITVIKDNKFISNVASTSGGAIFFDFSPPAVNLSSKFRENFAQVTNHIGSYPVQLILLNNETYLITDYIPRANVSQLYKDKELFKWDKIISGGINDRTYKFALIDMFNQLVYSDNSSLLEIYPDGFEEDIRSQFTNKLSLHATKGLYTLENFQFTSRTNQKLNVTFSSTAISNFNSLPVPDLIVLPSVTIEVSFRSCIAGEYMAFKGNLAYCVECPVGYWQVNPFESASSCEPCDQLSTLCEGANRIGIKKGYWRMNETATMVLECPRYESCLGSEQKGDYSSPVGKCASNYTGNLCNSCVAGWAKNNQEECVDCETDISAYFFLVGMFAFKGALIAFAVKETLHLDDQDTDSRSESSTAALFRIFISYSQIFSLIINAPVVWPRLLTRIFKIVGFFGAASKNLFTIDCIFSMIKQMFGVEIIFLKTLFETCNPFLFIVAGILFWILFTILKRQPILGNQELLDKLVTTIVIICFEMQPDVIKYSFALLQCTNLYSKKKVVDFLVNAFDIKCWESPHLDWVLGLVFPSLLLWVVVLPSLIFYILRKNKSKLDTIYVARKYSFIYDGYRKDKYYWEMIVIIRKVILVSNASFAVQNSTGLEIIFFFVLIFLSYILNAVNQPYANKELNDLEKISLISLGTVNLCGLYFLMIENNEIIDFPVIIVAILGNLYFILTFGKIFGSIQLRKIRKNKWLMKLFKKLGTKCRFCLKFRVIFKIFGNAKLIRKLPPIKKEIIFQPSDLKEPSHARELFKSDRSCLIEDIDPLNTTNNTNKSRQMLPSANLDSGMVRPSPGGDPKFSSARRFYGIQGIVTPVRSLSPARATVKPNNLEIEKEIKNDL